MKSSDCRCRKSENFRRIFPHENVLRSHIYCVNLAVRDDKALSELDTKIEQLIARGLARRWSRKSWLKSGNLWWKNFSSSSLAGATKRIRKSEAKRKIFGRVSLCVGVWTEFTCKHSTNSWFNRSISVRSLRSAIFGSRASRNNAIRSLPRVALAATRALPFLACGGEARGGSSNNKYFARYRHDNVKLDSR